MVAKKMSNSLLIPQKSRLKVPFWKKMLYILSLFSITRKSVGPDT